MRLPIYQIDAFADRLFGGNAAAIVPLESWLPEATMQAIAAENNIAETAFFAPEGSGYRLRWFTPEVEIDLCGHATLATAWLLLNRLKPDLKSVDFETKSGRLTVSRGKEHLLEMDFPSWVPKAEPAPDELIEALGGGAPEAVLGHRDWIVVYKEAAKVRALQPNFAQLARLNRSVIVTALGDNSYDFISRFFGPAIGIPEDPVTGSAHCQLTPYWATRLGKNQLKAFQASARGGVVYCVLNGKRLTLSGACVPYLEGFIEI